MLAPTAQPISAKRPRDDAEGDVELSEVHGGEPDLPECFVVHVQDHVWQEASREWPQDLQELLELLPGRYYKIGKKDQINK